MTTDTELRYIGESGDKYVFELIVDGGFQGWCSMRKAHHREFPKVIPDPLELTQVKHKKRKSK